ncbi:MAG: hypothetical protein JNM09_01615 [Blastocatellia bacterium]|nr:hypothetical protein [Blastocatellia bacterium]
MKLLLMISLLTSMITFDPLPSLPLQDDAQKAVRAQELLKQTRATLGCEKLKSLSFNGGYRQVMGEMEMAGEIEMEMLLPDSFYKAVTTSMMGAEITRVEAVNSETAWMDMRNSAPSGGAIMIRAANNNSTMDAQKAQEIVVRHEFARFLLGFIATAPASAQLEYSYAGIAEAPDGNADVIEVKGQLGFNAQLFLDQKTHLPLMLSYKARKPRVVTRMMSGGSPADVKKLTPEEIEKHAKEAREKAEAEPPVEYQLRFEDFSEEGGVKLPHRISKTIDGKITEEWDLKKFKINPSIKPNKFEKK